MTQTVLEGAYAVFVVTTSITEVDIMLSQTKLTPPVLAPPLFWNILYHSRQLAHRHFNNALLTHFFSNLLHLFNVLSPLIQDAVFRS